MAPMESDTPLIQELGSISEHPVAALKRLFEGAVVGTDVSTGHARPLVAGDEFRGFAESQADNRLGTVGGEITVRVIERGKVEKPIASLAITDIGAPVYASDDNTFTLTPGANSFVGRVSRYVTSGVGIISFDAGNLPFSAAVGS